ncbi:peptidyl-tRNA hydrolase domain protein [Cladophialophora carrionii]|uniref:Peptidyl-tRNA hydrolase domain protein n=1 Tax=Cladophialophora carrionii TaxID=86049 RepID=A0A1C1C675_9EURO|nr:peptidyl-tRNA hydrolase domain protein [Cladophialophora carrionii]
MLPWSRRSLCATVALWRSFASQNKHPELDYAAARAWYKSFNPLESLRDVGEVTFARSSGPGGQNVNKVNSKAQLRVPIGQLLPLLPAALHKPILTSRYYAENTSSLLIQADESRKAQANKDACYRKLNELIVDVFKHTVPGETTDEQKEKVKRLQKAENESRLRWKKLHSSKKQSRSSKRDSD